jgi:hypothetical protein
VGRSGLAKEAVDDDRRPIVDRREELSTRGRLDRRDIEGSMVSIDRRIGLDREIGPLVDVDVVLGLVGDLELVGARKGNRSEALGQGGCGREHTRDQRGSQPEGSRWVRGVVGA